MDQLAFCVKGIRARSGRGKGCGTVAASKQLENALPLRLEIAHHQRDSNPPASTTTAIGPPSARLWAKRTRALILARSMPSAGHTHADDAHSQY
jgi:hypothetical protein